MGPCWRRWVVLSTSGPVTVVAVGDLGAGDLDRTNQNKLDDQVAALAKAHGPDAIIGLGDLNQGLGCYEAYTSPGGFSGAWGAAGLKDKFLPVPGNHDRHCASATGPSSPSTATAIPERCRPAPRAEQSRLRAVRRAGQPPAKRAAGQAHQMPGGVLPPPGLLLGRGCR